MFNETNYDKLLTGLATPTKDQEPTLTQDGFYSLMKEEYENVLKLSLVEAKRLLEAMDKTSLDAWNGIPELQLSELTWGKAAPDTDAAGEVSMDARTQLESFLNQVGVGGNATIEAKLGALQAFFDKSTAKSRKGKTRNVTGTSLQRAKLAGSAKGGTEARENISRVMGYLTFYKTLTRILQNFNASAAGFTFESFIAVLLGGEQVPTGNQTIADLTAGNDIPISLKLLTDQAPNVKGSMRDLINDMVGAAGASKKKQMKYVVCLKNLTGEGQEISGEIKFYQFVFDINNMMKFLTLSTGKKSLELFQLPRGIRGRGIDIDREVEIDTLQPWYSEGATSDEEEEDESQEELTSWWVDNFDEFYEKAAAGNRYFNSEHKESLKRFMSPNGIPGDGTHGGSSKNLKQWALQFQDSPEVGTLNEKGARIMPVEYTVAHNAYKSMWDTYKVLLANFKKRKRELKGAVKGGSMWASTEESLKYLQSLQQGDPEAYAQALLKTRGYAGRIQWIVNKNQIEKATGELGQRAYIGRLFIGVQHVAEMVDMYRDMVSDNIFEIIRDLKTLVFYCNKFFAEGLQKENAQKVIESSQSINDKTKTVVNQDNSEEQK